MGVLGDFFSKAERTAFSARSLQVGTVLRDYDSVADKEKFFVVVGINGAATTMAAVLVNTEINKNVFHTPESQDLHVKMLAAECGGIFKWDCFVNCTYLHERESAKLQQRLADSPEIYCGDLTTKQTTEIKNTIVKADIPPYLLKRYSIRAVTTTLKSP